MSSSAIMELIKEKEKILEELTNVETAVLKLNNELSCVADVFSKAGAAISEAGTLNGKPFDNGKTAEKALEITNYAVSVEGIKGDLAGQIADLEVEIEELYAQYKIALAREEEERKRQLRLQSVYATGH